MGQTLSRGKRLWKDFLPATTGQHQAEKRQHRGLFTPLVQAL
jgi:hypothetical protein